MIVFSLLHWVRTACVHEVVGAFLAGLAVNATLPRHSPVTGHVLFMGESFFIPIFLLYSGMITDPLSFLDNSQTIIVALGVTIVAYVSKFIAAWMTARIFNIPKTILAAYGLLIPRPGHIRLSSLFGTGVFD